MTRYTVVVSPIARASLLEYVRYISEEKQAPLNAARWLRRVEKAIIGLAETAQQSSLAPENDLVDYELRMRIVGQYLVLFTIDEEERAVHVVGFRHGARLPRRGDLPESPNG